MKIDVSKIEGYEEMSAEESISVFSRLFGASMYADLRMWDEILIWS